MIMARLAPRQPCRKAKNNTNANDSTRANCGSGAACADSSSKIVIDGTDFSALNDAERTKMRKSKIGFIFQKFNLLPTLTSRQNIEIAYSIAGRKEPIDQAQLHNLTDMLGITDRLDHRPSELSGGQQQRVAIARALVMRPAIILADEPTGNLDGANAESVFALMLELNRELGTSLVVVTHDTRLAERMERIYEIEKGSLSERLTSPLRRGGPYTGT